MLATVSVAMAACNGARFLAHQVESILVQLDTDDELIISCDKSTDATREIAESFARDDGRVIVIDNVNPGIVGNFNNALAHCTRDAIFISDQDDVWVKGKRSKVMNVLNETNADLAIHNVVHIDESERVVSPPLFEVYSIGPGLLRNFARPRYSGCCMAFPRSTMRLIWPMPESVINYDHWIGMACEAFGKVAFIEDVLLYHRLHGSNATVQRRPLATVAQQRTHLLQALAARRTELCR